MGLFGVNEGPASQRLSERAQPAGSCGCALLRLCPLEVVPALEVVNEVVNEGSNAHCSLFAGDR